MIAGPGVYRHVLWWYVICRLVFYEHPVSGKNHSERVPAWGSTVSGSRTGFTLWDLQLDCIRYGTLSRKKGVKKDEGPNDMIGSCEFQSNKRL